VTLKANHEQAFFHLLLTALRKFVQIRLDAELCLKKKVLC